MTKKYFGTDGIRGRVGASLINPEFAIRLGWAAGIVLGKQNGGKVLIGKDTRISGYMLESALEAGLSAAGMDIHLLGPMPTPGIAYLTRTLRAEAGVVISASHNNYYDNGIKFFSPQGFKLADEFEHAIEAQLDRPMTCVESAELGKAVRIPDASGRYIEFCKSTVPHRMSLSGLKIVVDCAQGATYHVAPNVFAELGAEVIKLGVHPDGFNINANCGSTKPELLQKTVLEQKANLGIAFDGDGDRVLMVDHLGEIVDGDELLFIMVKDSLARNRFEGGIVGTVMTNLGLEHAFQQMNIPFKRTQVGDRYVLDELKKTGWTLGGENSGHIVNLNLTTTGDGIISALQVLHALCSEEKSLAELKKRMSKFPQVLINVPLNKTIKISEQPIIQSAIQAAEKRLGNKGRLLIRASGTEPVIRVMVEGEDKELVNTMAQELARTIEKQAA
jgi:phosphoglucosamine mutase